MWQGARKQKAGSPPHVVLGVAIDASSVEVKRAYKTLAKQWHPDRAKGDATYAKKQFTRIQEAYEEMCDSHYHQTRGGANQKGMYSRGIPSRGHPGIPTGAFQMPRRSVQPHASVLCNGTVLMGGGFRPSDMTPELLQQLQRNAAHGCPRRY